MSQQHQLNDVFVAYSSRDEAQVRTIVAWLRRNGLRVWVAYELPAGLDWDTEIDRVLAEIPCVLTVWSPDSVGSAEVKGEARLGMARDALVTVSLDRTLPPRSFTHLHAVDLSGLTVDEESARTAQLLQGVRSKLAGSDKPPVESADATSGEVASSGTPGGGGLRSSRWVYALGGLVTVAVLLLIVNGQQSAQAACDDQEAFRLAGQTFDQDTTIRKSVVCVADNANVRVKNGASLLIDAQTLVLQGVARFDGRGRDGAPGEPGSDGPRHTHEPWGGALAICANAPPRSDYDGKPGGRGGNGGAGATIALRYAELIGDAASLSHDVSGGKAGPGGRGGKAGRSVCKKGNPHVVNGQAGRRGPSGAAGAAGSFELVEQKAIAS
jgi:hypothetical protein